MSRLIRRPLFMIYNPLSIPDLPEVLDGWRARCDTAGVGIPIFGCFETFGNFERDPQELGCDATAEFLPHGIERFVNRTVSGEQFAADNTVIDYQELVDGHMQSPARTWPHFRTILPGWDNTPRRKNGWSIVLTGSTPELFGRWASASLRRARDESAPLVFVNAWNEWAEGAHLEPDLKFGRAYLEALATARGVDPEAELQPSGRDSGPESQPTGGAIPSAPQIGRLLLDKLRLERRAADAERRLIASYEARLADSGATKIADVVAGLTSLQASVSELSGRIDGAAEAAVTAAAASVSAAAASTAAAAASAEALAAASQRRTSLAGRLVRARRILRKDRRPGFRYLPKDHDLLDEP